MRTRCHLCRAECVREVEPAVGDSPAILSPDVWRVVARNQLWLDVCLACWMLWPDDWKHFPSEGFGRGDIGHEQMLELMREPA